MLFTAELFDISRKEFVSDIHDSSGLYVKSIILQINFYA